MIVSMACAFATSPERTNLQAASRSILARFEEPISVEMSPVPEHNIVYLDGWDLNVFSDSESALRNLVVMTNAAVECEPFVLEGSQEHWRVRVRQLQEEGRCVPYASPLDQPVSVSGNLNLRGFLTLREDVSVRFPGASFLFPIDPELQAPRALEVLEARPGVAWMSTGPVVTVQLAETWVRRAKEDTTPGGGVPKRCPQDR